MRVDITQDHIDRHNPSGYDDTALALAISDAIGGTRVVAHQSTQIYIQGFGVLQPRQTPALVKFVNDMFERPETLKPIRMEIAVLDTIEEFL